MEIPNLLKLIYCGMILLTNDNTCMTRCKVSLTLWLHIGWWGHGVSFSTLTIRAKTTSLLRISDWPFFVGWLHGRYILSFPYHMIIDNSDRFLSPCFVVDIVSEPILFESLILFYFDNVLHFFRAWRSLLLIKPSTISMFYYNNIASVSPGRKHESCLVSGKTKACAAMETPTRLEEANGGEEGRRSGEPTAGLIQNSPETRAVGGDETGKTSVKKKLSIA